MTSVLLVSLFLNFAAYAEPVFSGKWEIQRVDIQCADGSAVADANPIEHYRGIYLMFDCAWGEGSFSWSQNNGYEPSAYLFRGDKIDVFYGRTPAEVRSCDRASFSYQYDVSDRAIFWTDYTTERKECPGNRPGNAQVTHRYYWKAGCR